MSAQKRNRRKRVAANKALEVAVPTGAEPSEAAPTSASREDAATSPEQEPAGEPAVQQPTEPEPTDRAIDIGSVRKRIRRPNIATAVIALYVVGLFVYIGVNLYPAMLRLPWFASTDENVIVAEVIRFSGFDFHQRFYDMPGTPLMMLGAAEWRIYYTFRALFDGTSGGITSFSFSHIQQLFGLMRANSLSFFLLSAGLLFAIVRSFANRYAAALAATLLLHSGAYAGTVAFLRVEPMAMCFMLSSVLILIRCGRWKYAAAAAGFLGGIAAATRLHSITAVLPLLILLVFRNTAPQESRIPPVFRRFLLCLAGTCLLLFASSFFYFQFAGGHMAADYPFAFALLAKACAAAFILVAALLLLYPIPPMQPFLTRLLSRPMIEMLGGVTFGCLVGMPTIFTQSAFFLQSMNFYSSKYRDLVAAKLPFLERIGSFLSFYVDLIAPDKIILGLLIAGSLMIISLRRWRREIPYLVVGLLFFVSKPLDLVRAPHHVALWIPFYSLICALPLAAITEWVEDLKWPVSLPLALLTVAGLINIVRNNNYCPMALKDILESHLVRAGNIEESTKWLRAHTLPGTRIMVAQNCFGPETFYQWFRWMDVAVPAMAGDGRTYVTWWGEAAPLVGATGLVCMSPADTPYLKVWNLAKPGTGSDPLHDERFRSVQVFGSGFYAIHLLEFGAKSSIQATGEARSGISKPGESGKPAPPTAVSVSPNAGRGRTQLFTFTFSNSNGADNIVSAQMEVNPLLTQASACYLYYDHSSKAIQLANDSGQFQATLTLGQRGTAQNRQCAVDAGASSVSVSGDLMTVKLALSFLIPGDKNIYMEARNNALESGWTQQGTWTVP